MSREADHYAVLGVVPGSQDVVIEAAYHALIKRYEPDSSVNAARKRADVKAAFAVLGNAKSRAAYDKTRGYASVKPEEETAGRTTSRPTAQSSADGNPAAAGNPRRGVHPALWVVGAFVTLLFVAISTSPNSSTGAANNIMNVDENLATTDMNAATELTSDRNFNATDMNATDMNAGAADTNATDGNVSSEQIGPVDLSRQLQLPVTFTSIESASNWSANTLRAGGFTDARSASEQCHASVQGNPSWPAADRCAGFDYAAAYIDDLLARNGRATTHAYFQFARENQADSYTSIGAPSYSLASRLSEIRQAAEAAVNESVAAATARERAAAPAPVQPSASAPPGAAPGPPARIRVVPEGVLLTSETNLGDGTKRCRFNNGTERVIPFAADCFYR
jgi:curved DNA-binding protein CbpA